MLVEYGFSISVNNNHKDLNNCQQEPIKYGHVFVVSGELAKQPIAPKDAAMMQSTETTLLGQAQKGGPAAVMQSAAMRNERAGVVGHEDLNDIAGDQGMTAVET
ncbi:hypothetical protein IFM89_023809 [Coptis chinensis]|uniref:SMP domain-containing protein n=1 Tax=Coptis chinensis TaxID=261450 RepID=A0A835HV15_9MAGN|nr:hypothetical protein IFM89_023809 [Coptis chinensis]